MARKATRVKIPPDDLFVNETPPAMVDQSVAVTEAEIDSEEKAIDDLLNCDDEAFNNLDY